MFHEVPTSRKAIAMTFDDGPNPIYTPQVLDIFREVSGRATFYMIGEQMLKAPETVKAVAAEGHEIGNHTYSHPALTDLSPDDAWQELERTERLIETLTGRKPLTFRPPYLRHNEDTQTVVDRFGYSVAGALNGESKDWEMPGAEHIVDTSLRHARPGSVLLYHDGFGDRSQTIEAVRRLVRTLTDRGYLLVTVSELLELAER
ncbi:polysaccharide deacetylase family protein [Paenibacillus sp. IB182493]|uniref:Polysaccharide deacetylase family protein n=2 Tax=Paenibacillus arenilitoris TaxID=2772299 RepID=A0A927CL48_9BACL|nr:polysaccharide deacetylase family protein [Paenibacillus arenilitoris]